ncbi:MAG TPA: hypothetical protein VJH89_03135 [Patescibacteria group bacterium]|nr:hypothetical protein [Patescibacteria group bacterium]
MPQTFYIEADEEIISAIGRLRKSSEEDNIFVFPKHALILQSIINLRLFQREAQKLGKKIIIVSQDEVGRMLAQKAGIETENYSEDFSRKESHLELTHKNTTSPTTPSTQDTHLDIPNVNTIGSTDFHTKENTLTPLAQPLPNRAVVSPQTDLKTVRVRPVAPRFETTPSPTLAKTTSLYSAQTFSISQQQKPLPHITPPTPYTTPSTARGERLKNFYGITSDAQSKIVKQGSPKPTIPMDSNKAHTIFFVVGGISLLSFVGVALFLFLPKAEIFVTPYKITQTADMEFTGSVSASQSDQQTIAVRILERKQDINLTITTTGKSGGANQKASGTVILYNNYSTDPQQLVATTRLETEDGMLFRLVKGVTIPGMTYTNGKKDAGVIEVEVIADQTGETYNIDATTFNIPGFKGGPKYSAFSAKSTKPMTGGSSAGAANIAIVAKVDLDTAEREAKAKAKEDFLQAIRGDLSPDEKILDEHIDITTAVPTTVPSIGTVTNTFEYANTFLLRAFVFSEKLVKENIENASAKTIHGIVFKPISSSITYSDSTVNFSEQTLRLRAHAQITMESVVDRDALQKAFLGKNETDFQQAINTFPEVKKINVLFHPKWFVESVPDSKDRVIIIVEPGEMEDK